MDFNNLQEQNLIREVSFSLSRYASWMKFLGIAAIIYGVMTAMSIIGIIVAWLPIWMGYLLVKAASKAKTATSYGDRYALEEAMQNIGNYFIINGIVLIILLLASLAVLAAIFMFGFNFDPETFESILS
ncbi:MAG: DUF5362 domain-containing protein [Bacteroidia bacterium]|nr:DUF5362 domain-containing protein [Bacteroidia bacterium]